MATPTSSIDDKCTTLASLGPSSGEWFAKVVVSEKTQPRKTKWGDVQQYLVLTDKEHGKIHCIIYEQDIPQLDKVVKLYETYIIGNSKIKVTTMSVPALTNSEYHIILTRSSYIKPVKNEQSPVPLDQLYELTQFARCPELADSSGVRINLLCAVIHVFPKRFVEKNQRYVQDFVILNEESKPMILSLWEDFLQKEGPYLTENVHKMPIVLCTRLLVTTFYGLSVATVPNSVILYDPPLLATSKLQSWLIENKNYVDDVVNHKLYESQHQNVVQPLDSQLRKIGQIKSLSHVVKSFWVKAKVRLPKLEQRFYSLICPECSKGCGGVYGKEFLCLYCGMDYPKPTPLLNFEAELYDGTGTLNVHIENKGGEEMLQMSAEDLIAVGEKERSLMVSNKLKDQHMSYHVRTSTNTVRGKSIARYTVIACLPLTEAGSSSQASEGQTSSTGEKEPPSWDTPMMGTEESTSPTNGEKLKDVPASYGQLASKRSLEPAEPETSKHAKQD